MKVKEESGKVGLKLNIHPAVEAGPAPWQAHQQTAAALAVHLLP